MISAFVNVTQHVAKIKEGLHVGEVRFKRGQHINETRFGLVVERAIASFNTSLFIVVIGRVEWGARFIRRRHREGGGGHAPPRRHKRRRRAHTSGVKAGAHKVRYFPQPTLCPPNEDRGEEEEDRSAPKRRPHPALTPAMTHTYSPTFPDAFPRAPRSRRSSLRAGPSSTRQEEI